MIIEFALGSSFCSIN